MGEVQQLFEIVKDDIVFCYQQGGCFSIELPLKNISQETLFVWGIIYDQSESYTYRSMCHSDTMYASSYAHNRETPLEKVLGAGEIIKIELFSDWYRNKTTLDDYDEEVPAKPGTHFDGHKFECLENFRVCASKACNGKPIKKTAEMYLVCGKISKEHPEKKHFWEIQKPKILIFKACPSSPCFPCLCDP